MATEPRESTLDGPEAQRGRSPGRVHTQGAASTFRTVICLLLFAGMWVAVEPAPVSRVHDPAAVQGLELDSSQTLCSAGFHLDKDGRCKECEEGEDYTNHTNTLASCIPCSICRNDKEEKTSCTRTRDTVCQCKPGTFQGPESPEFCQRCSTRCPEGMIEESPCTPWSDLKCVHQESGNDNKVWVAVPLVVLVLLLILAFLVWKYRRVRVLSFVKSKCLGYEQDSELVNTVSNHPSRQPEALDNDRNETLSSRHLQSTLDRQELVTSATEELPGEAQSLLRAAEEVTSPARRRLLVPADGTDPIETIRLFFSSHPDIVPCTCWNKLMRLLGLTDNEIYAIRSQTNMEDTLYEMVMKWISKTGQAASINTLLDALGTLGETASRENIEEYMVRCGKFHHQEDEADTAVSCE